MLFGAVLVSIALTVSDTCIFNILSFVDNFVLISSSCLESIEGSLAKVVPVISIPCIFPISSTLFPWASETIVFI